MPSQQPQSNLWWKSEAPIQTSKPTIVFLHAAWMSSAMWQETVDLLNHKIHQECNLILVDLNGHGKTSNGRETFTLTDQAQDVAALLEHLEIAGPLIIAGVSMGAMVSLRIALLPTNLNITGLILLGVNTTPPSDAAKASLKYVRDIWTSTAQPSEDIMNLSIQAWGGSPDIEGPRAKKVKEHWVERHSGSENVDNIMDSINNQDDIRGRLREVAVQKVLLVHGSDDLTYPVGEAELVKKGLTAVGDVRLEILDGVGHLVFHIRKGEDVVRLIERFVVDVFG